jgi:hypothetical protein
MLKASTREEKGAQDSGVVVLDKFSWKERGDEKTTVPYCPSEDWNTHRRHIQR